jgi:hypothetical protein
VLANGSCAETGETQMTSGGLSDAQLGDLGTRARSKANYWP